MVNQSVFLVECSNFWNVNCASALPHSSASVCFRSVSVCVFLFIFYARISKILKSTGSKNNNFSGLVFKLFNGILMWYFGNHLCKSLTKPNDFIFRVYFHAIQNQNAVCGSWTRVCNTVQGPSIDRESVDFIWLHIFITFLLSPMAITTNNKQHPSSSLSGFFLFDSRHRLTYHQTKQRLFKLNILIQACVWKQWWWRVAWPASHPFERLRKKKWWRVDKQTSHQFV